MSIGTVNRREFLASGVGALVLGVMEPSFAQPADATDLTIAASSRLIRSGVLSPSELVSAYFGRIDNLDRRLNAFVTLMEEQAVTRARELEQELARGEWRGPLHGIPIANAHT